MNVCVCVLQLKLALNIFKLCIFVLQTTFGANLNVLVYVCMFVLNNAALKF